jgi:hypothetical protein
MVTKKELAAFIAKVANEAHSRHEWQQVAVAHYRDPVMEEARRKLVHLVNHESKQMSQEQFEEALNGLLVSLLRK